MRYVTNMGGVKIDIILHSVHKVGFYLFITVFQICLKFGCPLLNL